MASDWLSHFALYAGHRHEQFTNFCVYFMIYSMEMSPTPMPPTPMPPSPMPPSPMPPSNSKAPGRREVIRRLEVTYEMSIEVKIEKRYSLLVFPATGPHVVPGYPNHPINLPSKQIRTVTPARPGLKELIRMEFVRVIGDEAVHVQVCRKFRVMYGFDEQVCCDERFFSAYEFLRHWYKTSLHHGHCHICRESVDNKVEHSIACHGDINPRVCLVCFEHSNITSRVLADQWIDYLSHIENCVA